MENSIACLDEIIGVTRKDCGCISDDLKDGDDNDWYKKSTSGLYIHELEGVVDIDTVKDVVSCSKLREHYTILIENSTKDVAKMVTATMMERYAKKESDFVGQIGSRTTSDALQLPDGFAGLKVDVRERTGGVMVIKALGIMLDTTSEFEIVIYRRYVETDIYEVIDTIQGINSIAGVYTNNILEQDIILPMEIENENDIEYYFMYEMNGMQPMNNLASCGCGKREKRLKALVDYGGVNGSDIDYLGSWSMSSYGNGIVLDCELRCNAEATICLMMKNSPAWSGFMAEAILLKAAYKLNKSVITSNNITQDLMANREMVERNMNEFESELMIRIRWMVQNIDLKLTDCYVCSNRNARVTQILL